MNNAALETALHTLELMTDDQRGDFFPRHFGEVFVRYGATRLPLFIAVENRVFDFAKAVIKEYGHGHWELAEIALGESRAPLMLLPGSADVEARSPITGGGGQMSPLLASIAVNAWMLEDMINRLNESDHVAVEAWSEKLFTYMDALRDIGHTLAGESGQGQAFFRLLD